MKSLGLADAIEQIRRELVEARKKGVDAEVQFPVESVTVELQMLAADEGGGKAGFKIPVINLELGLEGGVRSERTHTVTMVFGPPTGRDGKPLQISQRTQKDKE